MGRPWQKSALLLVMGLSFGCAHGGPQGNAGPEAESLQAPPSRQQTDHSEKELQKWDPPSPDTFEQCRIEGEKPELECRDQWGYFFLRVLNRHRISIPAYLSFNPAVNRVVAREDGFAGLLRPGEYQVTVESPGYQQATLTFTVDANHKALLEMELSEKPEDVQ